MDEKPETGFTGKPPDGLEILDCVGVGRRSAWYRARQTRLDRDVAVKRLRPALAESEEFSRRFLDAGRQAASIVHPAALHIINLYPLHHCIAVQWCPGRALADCKGHVDAVQAARIGVMAMDCLASLHATNRCHGNLSPGNILMDDQNGIWVTDFFQPPIMKDGERTFRSSQRYIAPEDISGAAMSDWRSDVFGLGCVLNDLVSTTPDGCSRDFLALLEYMRALDPVRRGESPQTILEALKKVAKTEEARVGITGETIRRRRMYRRVPIEFAVSMRKRSATPGETATILNKIRDIGESGVFVETSDELISIGSIIELDFTLKGVEGNVHAFGVVRWQSKPPMPKGVGVQFMEVDQEGLSRLRSFLEQKQEGQ